MNRTLRDQEFFKIRKRKNDIMKKILTTLSLFTFITLCTVSSLSAQDFVYKPVNPAFGGDTFNYNWLLSSAQVQDNTEADDLDANGGSLDFFTESLNRQLLNQLSRELVTSQFGEEGLTDGVYTVGDFQIDIASTFDGLSISIIDASTGEQTQIIIPYF